MNTITAEQITAAIAARLAEVRESYPATTSVAVRLGLATTQSGYGIALYEQGADADGNGTWDRPEKVAFIGYLSNAALPARNRCERLAKEAGIHSLD